MTTEYRCAVCGEVNETIVDESAGLSQRYTEDCRVCCRPNLLSIHIEGDEVMITTEFDE
jgi:hypothetical protein